KTLDIRGFHGILGCRVSKLNNYLMPVFQMRETMPHTSKRSTVLVSLSLLALVCVAAASSESVLYSFAGGNDGSLPTSTLVADKRGNLYGTASQGGNSDTCGPFGVQSCGVVFELISTNGTWTEQVIYSFTGQADGGTPYGGLVIDAAGHLYGTTSI